MLPNGLFSFPRVNHIDKFNAMALMTRKKIYYRQRFCNQFYHNHNKVNQ